MDLLGWAFTAIALTGTILNIKQLRQGFIYWMASNSYWACYNYNLECYPQAFLFSVYTALAIWGYSQWDK